MEELLEKIINDGMGNGEPGKTANVIMQLMGNPPGPGTLSRHPDCSGVYQLNVPANINGQQLKMNQWFQPNAVAWVTTAPTKDIAKAANGDSRVVYPT